MRLLHASAYNEILGDYLKLTPTYENEFWNFYRIKIWFQYDLQFSMNEMIITCQAIRDEWVHVKQVRNYRVAVGVQRQKNYVIWYTD